MLQRERERERETERGRERERERERDMRKGILFFGKTQPYVMQWTFGLVESDSAGFRMV